MDTVRADEGHISAKAKADFTGEITAAEKFHHETVVRGVQNIGVDFLIDDLSSVDSKGLNYQNCDSLFHINKQSPDIAGGVHVVRDDLDAGVDDQSGMARLSPA